MTLDNKTADFIWSQVHERVGVFQQRTGWKPETKKVGRQGYALVLSKDFQNRWYFTVETQNGVEVVGSSLSYSRRWDAIRSARRLMGDNLKHVYVEYDNGDREEI